MGVLLIGGVLAAGLMLAAVFAALGRMRHSSAALEQCARELLVRLQALEASVEKTERTLGEGLSAFREETRSARGRPGRNSSRASRPLGRPRPGGWGRSGRCRRTSWTPSPPTWGS